MSCNTTTAIEPIGSTVLISVIFTVIHLGCTIGKYSGLEVYERGCTNLVRKMVIGFGYFFAFVCFAMLTVNYGLTANFFAKIHQVNASAPTTVADFTDDLTRIDFAFGMLTIWSFIVLAMSIFILAGSQLEYPAQLKKAGDGLSNFANFLTRLLKNPAATEAHVENAVDKQNEKVKRNQVAILSTTMKSVIFVCLLTLLVFMAVYQSGRMNYPPPSLGAGTGLPDHGYWIAACVGLGLLAAMLAISLTLQPYAAFTKQIARNYGWIFWDLVDREEYTGDLTWLVADGDQVYRVGTGSAVSIQLPFLWLLAFTMLLTYTMMIFYASFTLVAAWFISSVLIPVILAALQLDKRIYIYALSWYQMLFFHTFFLMYAWNGQLKPGTWLPRNGLTPPCGSEHLVFLSTFDYADVETNSQLSVGLNAYILLADCFIVIESIVFFLAVWNYLGKLTSNVANNTVVPIVQGVKTLTG